MPAGIASRLNEPKINPRFLPLIDRVLIAGMKLAPSGKGQVINKVLKLVPEWRRGDCWQRIRHLRKTLAIATPQNHQPSEPCAGKTASLPRQRPVRWTREDDDKLLTWAGYESVDKIAERLKRSAHAVRFRLCALGISGRVTDGWSSRSLMKLIRVSPDRLRHLIGSGMLRVRDPRLTATSLAKFCRENSASFTPATLERVAAAIAKKHEAYRWEKAAALLGVELPQLQMWISTGHLKVMDSFITDRSFEEFCHMHGREINMGLIDPATRKWLIEEYGVLAPGSSEQVVPRAKKHALKMRTCRCGREIAGNVFFRHLKACKVSGNQMTRKAVS